ncbi:MAG: DNA alkylation repair protein [Candidatus Roizmanbacteria bacterium]|nr:DNA alkylation repair protein [Candidatus Roizmanbacteria bacterium]
MLSTLMYDISILADPSRAKHSARFFKTKKGEYGAGDTFVGLTVPQVRGIAKKYKNLSFSDIEELLQSPIHEYRLCALIILVNRSKNATLSDLTRLKKFYLKNKKYINNWDLVDASAHHILGKWCFLTKNDEVLKTLAHSDQLWDKRIAMVATFAYIRNCELEIVFTVANILLHDSHDLIHKAAGWMLRETGKRDVRALENFLNVNAETMPRTALRYSLEKFPPEKRKLYMNK